MRNGKHMWGLDLVLESMVFWRYDSFGEHSGGIVEMDCLRSRDRVRHTNYKACTNGY